MKNKKSIKINKQNTKQKIILKLPIIINIINFVLVAAFFVYLYFWIKRH